MQEYIIEKVLKDLPDWVAASLRENKCYVAGGSLTSVVTNKPINDYDIYFPSKESLLEVVKDFKEENPHCSFISDKSITYSLSGGISVQFIYYDFYKTAKSIFKHFDYTINMAAIDLAKNKVVMDKYFMLHNAQRYLSFNKGTKFPMISALRVQKYRERGYYISRSEYMKILMAVNKLKLKNWEDFSSAVGNLYGLNFVDKGKMEGKFSLDKAFKLIEETDFDGVSIPEYKFEPKLVDVMLSEVPIKYARLKSGDIIHDHEEEGVSDLIETGAIKAEEVTIKSILGNKLYKWVKEDLSSIHYSDFKYKLGEEVVAEKQGWGNGTPTLFFTNIDNISSHGFSYGAGRVCIEVDYKEEDVYSVNNYEIQVTKVTPIRVLGNKEEVQALLGKQNNNNYNVDTIPFKL